MALILSFSECVRAVAALIALIAAPLGRAATFTFLAGSGLLLMLPRSLSLRGGYRVAALAYFIRHSPFGFSGRFGGHLVHSVSFSGFISGLS